jgi:ABC-2 type transport system permease protein
MTASSPLAALLRAQVVMGRRWVSSMRTESRLKVVFVSASAAVVWAGVFLFAYGLLDLLERFGRDLLGNVGTVSAVRLTDLVLQRLLSAFALTVLVLLLLSNALAAFAALYRSREVAFLLQTPISISTLFLSRFVEVVTFSSWALGFLGAPALLAYGLQRGVPWGFYLALPVFFVPFVVIPAGGGCIAAMALVRLLGGVRRGTLLLGALTLGGVLLALFRARLVLPDLSQAETLRAILDVLGRTRTPWLPSSWLADGLFAAAGGRLGEAVFYLLLLVANAGFVVWLATATAEALFFRGWSARADPSSLGSAARAAGAGGRRSGLETLLGPLPEPARSLVIKDLRLFWRDPAQWSQFVIFFGLMALYVANMRHRGSELADAWRSWITILNTSATMLILATLTTRFVFPLVSLEGRRFWILGLAPLTRRFVVAQKFWLAVAATSTLTVGLALLSGLRLRLEPAELAFSLFAIVATTFALCGLSVGLGALYPNLVEESPSRIVSGLGGTLNFILSFLFIAAIAAAQAFMAQWRRLHPDDGPLAMLGAAGFILALTALATWLPLRAGVRNLERLEL